MQNKNSCNMIKRLIIPFFITLVWLGIGASVLYFFNISPVLWFIVWATMLCLFMMLVLERISHLSCRNAELEKSKWQGKVEELHTLLERKAIPKEKWYRSIFENSIHAIVVSDVNGKIIDVNPAFTEMYGWSLDEVIGLQLPMVPSDLQMDVLAMNQRVLLGEKLKSIETIGITKYGKQLDVNLSVSSIVEDDGNVKIFSIAKDITQEKKTSELLLKAEKLSLAGQLAAGIAHEIRNPLTSIKGFLQLMKLNDFKLSDLHLNLMLSEIDRILDIIKEFLYLAKPFELKYERINLIDILHQMVQLFNPQSALHNVQLIFESNLDEIYIHGEANQLKQALINILKNAMESMENKGGSIFIHVLQVDGQAVVSIQDQGCGISKARLKKIGEPFYTTKEKGSGLGMMLTFKIIQEHLGTMEIESKEGVGTLVIIKLPMKEDANIKV